MPSCEKEDIPRKFKNLKALNRCKKLSLGLPVPLIRQDEIPWGYERDPNNPKVAVPIETCMNILYKAREYLKESSYADVANWLRSCGYPISPWGLNLLMRDRYPFNEILLPLEERWKAYNAE